MLLDHFGEANAIPAKELSVQLSIPETNDTASNTRKLIKDLMENHDIPIGSCSKGLMNRIKILTNAYARSI